MIPTWFVQSGTCAKQLFVPAAEQKISTHIIWLLVSLAPSLTRVRTHFGLFYYLLLLIP